MLRKRRNLIAIGLILTIGLVIILIVSLPSGQGEAAAVRSIAQVASEGRRIYASLDSSPVSADSVRVRETIDSASIINEARISADMVELLLDEVSEFIAVRFGQDSPSLYREWRAERGDQWVERSEIESVWDLPRWYEEHTGSPYPLEAPLEELFDTLWRSRGQMNDAYNRLTGIASDAPGLAVTIGRMTANNPSWSFLSGDLSLEMWYGKTAQLHRTWWPASITEADLLARDGEAVYASVGVIAEFGGRWRRPMIMTYYWDPEKTDWVLNQLTTHNDNSGKIVPLDH